MRPQLLLPTTAFFMRYGRSYDLDGNVCDGNVAVVITLFLLHAASTSQNTPLWLGDTAAVLTLRFNADAAFHLF